MTSHPQAFQRIPASRSQFGIHALLASTVSNDYYPELARQLFELAAEVCMRQESLTLSIYLRVSALINNLMARKIRKSSVKGVRQAHEAILTPAGLDSRLYGAGPLYVGTLMACWSPLLPIRKQTY